MARKPVPAGKKGKTGAAAALAADDPAAGQLERYEAALALFAERKFAEAAAEFELALEGPATHIADKARSYLQVCRRRASSFDLKLTSAEDHFNYGVERLNSRDTDVARRHLAKALELQPKGDHILYTLALCEGLDGHDAGACENLKRAIDIDPRNRILARQDPEFGALAAQLPALKALLSSQL